MSKKYIVYHLIIDDVPGTQFVKPFIWWFDLSSLLEFVERYKIDNWYIVKASSEDDDIDKIIARSKKNSENLTSYLTKKKGGYNEKETFNNRRKNLYRRKKEICPRGVRVRA